MAEEAPSKKTHKEWRKEVKKLRRKRIRQKLAKERNEKAAEEEAARLNDPEYQAWLKEQEDLEAFELEQEERHRQEQKELWLRRELLAEKKFREKQRRHEATAAAKEAERLRIQKEFEELQQQAQKRREERIQREEQARKAYEQMMERIDEYIEFGGPIPEELKSNVQSHPNKQLCPFYSKCNACRYGVKCCRNHIRPNLSRILFFPHFFSHIKLEQIDGDEYGCDDNLECTEKELYHAYTEFFEDVIEELKKYGEIMNFRTCMNCQPHLRGNVLVEYTTERDALRAYMKLQGRYYASRQINVEFSPIVTWKSAICGLSYSNKCPKGRDCNFLHIFKNPGNVFNIWVFKQEDSTRKTSQRETRNISVASWNDGDDHISRRNWRWSESPEPYPVKTTNDDGRSKQIKSKKRDKRSCSRSERSSKRSSRYDEKYETPESKEEKSSYSSRDSHRDRDSSTKRKERRRSKSKSPKISRKQSKESRRKKHHKDKKRRRKSSRSRS